MSFLESLRYYLFPPKNPEEIAKKLTEEIAGSSFKFFKKPKFRELVDYEKLDQTERDRIFNELVVTNISLAILMFGYMEKLTKKENAKQFYSGMQIEMASRYGNWLKEIGTPQEFVDLWKQLIEMRTDEYRNDYRQHQKELEKEWKKNPWVFVTAIGGFDHITRGKGNPHDPLFKMIIHWTAEIAEKIANNTLKLLG